MMGIEVMTVYLVDFVHFLDERKEVTTFEAVMLRQTHHDSSVALNLSKDGFRAF